MEHHLPSALANGGGRLDLGKGERLGEERRVVGGYESTKESSDV